MCGARLTTRVGRVDCATLRAPDAGKQTAVVRGARGNSNASRRRAGGLSSRETQGAFVYEDAKACSWAIAKRFSERELTLSRTGDVQTSSTSKVGWPVSGAHGVRTYSPFVILAGRLLPTHTVSGGAPTRTLRRSHHSIATRFGTQHAHEITRYASMKGIPPIIASGR